MSVPEQLRDECAGWVVEMLADENCIVDEDLVVLTMEYEERLPRPAREMTVDEAAHLIGRQMEADGVRGVPDAVTEALLSRIVGWVDEFLGLAGIPRR